MMRARDWTFVVVPGAMVVAEAYRLCPGIVPCGTCWCEAGGYVKVAFRRRRENAR